MFHSLHCIQKNRFNNNYYYTRSFQFINRLNRVKSNHNILYIQLKCVGQSSNIQIEIKNERKNWNMGKKMDIFIQSIVVFSFLCTYTIRVHFIYLLSSFFVVFFSELLLLMSTMRKLIVCSFSSSGLLEWVQAQYKWKHMKESLLS